MYKIYFSKPADKDLRKFSKAVLRKIKEELIVILLSNPYVGKSLHGDLRGFFKYEFSHQGVNYRLVYEILKKKSSVIINKIGTRENFYENLKRRLK